MMGTGKKGGVDSLVDNHGSGVTSDGTEELPEIRHNFWILLFLRIEIKFQQRRNREESSDRGTEETVRRHR